MSMREFIESQRFEILEQSTLRLAARAVPVVMQTEKAEGIPLFLSQICDALSRAELRQGVNHDQIASAARRHGEGLFHRGFTIAQVVHHYGDICQVITGLAVEHHAALDAAEFQTLNLCLDDAIAEAVTAFGRQRERAASDDATEKLGFLAHELRNALGTALLSFASIKRGRVAPGGSTSTMLERSLVRMNILLDRSLAEVRLEAGKLNLEPVAVAEIVEEVEVGGALVAEGRNLHLDVAPVDRAITVLADRPILAAAVANLVQNAIKFTRPGTAVKLRVRSTPTRVLIDVEDECGGLPEGNRESLLRPFTQRSRDKTGLGLGLAICAKAMLVMSGEIRIEDVPGKGCVFTLDLPLAPPSAVVSRPSLAAASQDGHGHGDAGTARPS